MRDRRCWRGVRALTLAAVAHYNFAWEDMATPRNEWMLVLVQTMENHVHRGDKVAVHCHAGFGAAVPASVWALPDCSWPPQAAQGLPSCASWSTRPG